MSDGTTRSRDILLIAIGSHGDVHPFVGIGRALAARGHRVRVAANEHFSSMIDRAGLGVIQLGDEKLFRDWIADPLVWHSTKGPGRVMKGVSETIDLVYEMTVAETNADTLIVGSSLALGALIAAEKHSLRFATAHLGPICARSSARMPTLAPNLNFTRFPDWFKRKFWEGADRFFIDPNIAPAVNALRVKLGLAPVSRILNSYWNAPRLTLGLWPEWFSALQPDHPPQLRLTGFPLYDEADHQRLDPDLLSWLESGPPPIVFTPGSAMIHGHAFFSAAARACESMNRRGLLLTRHIEQIPGHLPPLVRHHSYAPFSALLPRCGALVHHGGIGTTGQALRAGVPQLIMPMAHDQPDNAAHIKRLGTGDAISPKLFWPGRIAKKLTRLLTDPSVDAACAKAANHFVEEDSMQTTVKHIESLAD